MPDVEPDNADKERVAYHEAGHAVVAIRLGFTVRVVSIGPPGFTQVNTDLPPPSPESVCQHLAWAAYCIAGIVAEVCVGRTSRKRWGTDRKYLEGTFNLLVEAGLRPSDGWRDFRHLALQGARTILGERENWLRVGALVDELRASKSGFVIGDRVHQIVDER